MEGTLSGSSDETHGVHTGFSSILGQDREDLGLPALDRLQLLGFLFCFTVLYEGSKKTVWFTC